MRSLLGDVAVEEDEDLVGAAHGRKAMGDDDRRAATLQPVEGGLDLGLGFGIERRGRLVEEDDRRVAEEGAGDGNALALAAGKFGAALAKLGVVAAPA